VLTTHFVKPTNNLKSIIENVDNAKKNGAQTLTYTLKANINVCIEKYYEISENLSVAIPIISEYGNQMLPDEYGIWSCVSISCYGKPSIIFYTAGHTAPVYVSYN